MKWFNWNSTSKKHTENKLFQLETRVLQLEEARKAHLEIMKNQSKQLLILSELVLKSITPPKLKKD